MIKRIPEVGMTYTFDTPVTRMQRKLKSAGIFIIETLIPAVPIYFAVCFGIIFLLPVFDKIHDIQNVNGIARQALLYITVSVILSPVYFGLFYIGIPVTAICVYSFIRKRRYWTLLAALFSVALTIVPFI